MTSVDPQTVALLRRRLEEAERILQLCRQMLSDTEEGGEGGKRLRLDTSEETPDGSRVVHGAFDGEHMIGEDSEMYPVPANYASKSKLVEGDKLKLTIQPDGGFVYKQIGPIERIRVRGVFDSNDRGQYVVRTEEKEYRILLASVTFYHIEPGDRVTVLLPAEGEAVWGAVDNVLKAGETESAEETES